MGKPSIKDIELRWFYWHACALEETGESKKAKQIYLKLSKERLLDELKKITKVEILETEERFNSGQSLY